MTRGAWESPAGTGPVEVSWMGRTLATFPTAWYRHSEYHFGSLLAMEDTGQLVVGERGLVFYGHKGPLIVADVERIKYCRQGWGFSYRWVRIDYGPGWTAFFVDGSKLGYGGIFGGTRRILQAVSHLGPVV
jgi:hypothetical protein